MLNYKSIHYEEYHIMLEDGTSFPTDRKTCFTPAEPVTADNLYPQRWYYSPDRKLAIRLPRNETGERIGKDNAADLKAQERYAGKKHECIGNTSHASCPVTCDTCPCNNYCISEHRKENGIGCTRKCDCCQVYVGRTIEMDKPINEADDGTVITMDFPNERENTEATYAEKEQQALIRAVIDTLSPEDQLLWKCLISKVKKVEVAQLLGITVDGVTYRQNRLYRILLANPVLRSIFMNL